METNLNAMGRFYERLGKRVILSENGSWFEVQPRVFLSFPSYKVVEPNEGEIEDLMRKYKLRAIRYPTTLDSLGFVSTFPINTNQDYDLDCLHQKARNQTRRGMENCRVEEVDFDYLEKNGLALNRDTGNRQGFKNLYSYPSFWAKYCRAAGQTSGVSAWGSFVEGQLGSFLVAVQIDDCVEWVVNHSSTALRKKYANNALVFLAAQHFFQKKGCKAICYGLGSLESTVHLDHFKQRMGWTLRPIKQQVIFSKRIGGIFSLANEPFLKTIGGLFPRNYYVRKTIAMIRLHRQQTYDVPTFESEQKPKQGKK